MPDLAPAQLTEALTAQECVLQQLIAAATEEHQRETSPPAPSAPWPSAPTPCRWP
ncbi:MAG TPA: hypothetical protein VNM38_13070 [Solirubrobacterales bacterium]|nr:hypothetical protein [Solirubrobacterales bacterium]